MASSTVSGRGKRPRWARFWLAPLVTRSVAQAALIPLGVPAMLVIFVLILRRAEFGLPWPMALGKDSSKMTPGADGASRGHDIAAFKS
jgi:hypothetical protein